MDEVEQEKSIVCGQRTVWGVNWLIILVSVKSFEQDKCSSPVTSKSNKFSHLFIICHIALGVCSRRLEPKTNICLRINGDSANGCIS